MKALPRVILVPVIPLLAACSPGGNEAADKSPDDKALLESAQKPLEPARQIEQQLQDAAEAQQRKIDEQTR